VIKHELNIMPLETTKS